ncbi:hypothetical protein CPT76_05745, partial [Paenibacillus sp. AR247]
MRSPERRSRYPPKLRCDRLGRDPAAAGLPGVHEPVIGPACGAGFWRVKLLLNNDPLSLSPMLCLTGC